MDFKHTNFYCRLEEEVEKNSKVYIGMRDIGISEYAIRQAIYSNVAYRYSMIELKDQIFLTSDKLEGSLYLLNSVIRRYKEEKIKILEALEPLKTLYDEASFKTLQSMITKKIQKKYYEEVHSQLVKVVCQNTRDLLYKANII